MFCEVDGYPSADNLITTVNPLFSAVLFVRLRSFVVEPLGHHDASGRRHINFVMVDLHYLGDQIFFDAHYWQALVGWVYYVSTLFWNINRETIAYTVICTYVPPNTRFDFNWRLMVFHYISIQGCHVDWIKSLFSSMVSIAYTISIHNMIMCKNVSPNISRHRLCFFFIGWIPGTPPWLMHMYMMSTVGAFMCPGKECFDSV